MDFIIVKDFKKVFKKFALKKIRDASVNVCEWKFFVSSFHLSRNRISFLKIIFKQKKKLLRKVINTIKRAFL